MVSAVRWLQELRRDFWVLEGKMPGSGASLSILCAASDQDRGFLAGLAYGPIYSERRQGRFWLWNAKRMVEKKGRRYSMMVVKVRKSQRWVLGSRKWFWIPDWVYGSVDLPLERKSMNAEKVKSDMRRIRNNKLEYEVTRDVKRFDDFYYNMYRPHIVKAHGSNAFVKSYELMRKRFEHCELLLVKMQDEYIAGCMIAYNDELPRLKSLGVRDGDLKYMRCGATGALYFFSMIYLQGKGFSKYELGGSRAFLHDGVLQYKKKWGQGIIGMTSEIFALKVVGDSAATRSFLSSNPFIFEQDGALNGAVFIDSDDKLDLKEFENMQREFFYPGLSKLYVCFLEGEKAAAPSGLPKELSERTVFLTTAQWNGVRDFQRKN